MCVQETRVAAVASVCLVPGERWGCVGVPLGASCAAWVCVGVDEGGTWGRSGRKQTPRCRVGIGACRTCRLPPLRSLVGWKHAVSWAVRAACHRRHPPWGQRIALLPALGKRPGHRRDSDGHRRVPSVPDALSPLWWTQQLSISLGQDSSCQTSASHALCLRAKPSRPDAALPFWRLCSLLLLDHVSLPPWQSAASPLLGAEKKLSASLYF